jgi:GTP-binding protein
MSTLELHASDGLPVVAIVGRPNVGKSTLANRIVGRRVSVVAEQPGVTRDRVGTEASFGGRRFLVVDTGGYLDTADPLGRKVSSQVRRALEEAAVVVVVADVTVGATEEDRAVARLVARSGRPAVVASNKADSPEREREAHEHLALGLGDPVPVSALHGRGVGELLERVLALMEAGPAPAGSHADLGHGLALVAGVLASEVAPGEPAARTEGRLDPDASADGTDVVDETPRVAIVGRPNVGKSTLFNRLVGDERSVVHDVPGTTRDAIDTVVVTPAGPLRLIDTAGLRRGARTEPGVEWFAASRALGAIDMADVVLLVIDAAEGVTHQDQRLAERILAAGSPVVAVLNKWDLVAPERREEVVEELRTRLRFVASVPVVRTSGITGLGVHRLVPAVGQALAAYRTRVPTGQLNRAIQRIQEAHAPPAGRIRYAVQGATEPPTITLFASRRLPESYLRYVERQLRERFELGPTPLKLRVRTLARRR